MILILFLLVLLCDQISRTIYSLEQNVLGWLINRKRGRGNKDYANNTIRDRLGVAPIEEKFVQHRLRWFGHVQRRPSEAPVHRGVLSQDNNAKRGRGRPKLTWGR
jgi:hypothetical protein